MKRQLTIVSALLVSLSLCMSAKAITFGTTGTYDENVVATNTVDSSVGAKAVGQFASDVSTAFSSDRGGVIDFETGTSFANVDHNLVGASFDADYGASQAKNLTISSNIAVGIWQNNIAGQTQVISALPGKNNSMMIANGINNQDTHTLTFGTITGGLAAEAITEVGLTVNSRSVYDANGRVDITATFSDGSTSVLTANVGNTAGGNDTFYHFEAPEGRFVSSITVDGSLSNPGGTANQRRVPFDDLAFITQQVGDAAAFVATGIYDENVNATNTVDQSVGGKSVGQFASEVASAFANGEGGVIDFETGTNFGNVGENVVGSTTTFGFGSKILNVSTDVNLAVFTNNIAGQSSVISSQPGQNNSALQANALGDQLTLTFDSITNAAANEFLTEIGVTILPRTTFGPNGEARLVAFFSDGSSQELIATVGNVPGAGETFFHFSAANGHSITSLLFDGSLVQAPTLSNNNNQARLPFDDFAFITTTIVPEPTTLALLGFAAMGLGCRRRRCA